jgi:hypothetical protein
MDFYANHLTNEIMNIDDSSIIKPLLYAAADIDQLAKLPQPGGGGS